jgi:hypothetical protein
MPIHQENIFRYLLACFLIALVGFTTAWQLAERDHRTSMASKSEASLAPDDVPGDHATSSQHQ